MQKCIVGKKIGMTQLFDENGKVIPVTVVEAGPCVVVQKKTIENDGYEAVQSAPAPAFPVRSPCRPRRKSSPSCAPSTSTRTAASSSR